MGHTEVVIALLERNADKDKRLPINPMLLSSLAAVSYGETPLLIASYRGNKDIVTALLESGVCSDKRKRSALEKACEGGHTDVAQLLISHGAPTDDLDDRLSAITRYDEADAVKLLIESGMELQHSKSQASNLQGYLSRKARRST
ncbi:hypothetical protein PHYSODRAFT_355998 [Phytophthora sojae]|uniref:Uncharacterized protein n=1 Tax=Phytophthora sojae (strain P6497) TaxID=1094619 RepID=G5A9F1_PHYSP|nr:hypothetical protein PHYSODRAFT_355998 [Phytophthora sojae]EGZ08526.1 hypothetical protein PHYSODRAFT_355998 [Phytophthora sojae]|eukprot:XP_009536698.1 hypothetical protein PHYSODRAFT_355998 [Phytophthora sojae]